MAIDAGTSKSMQIQQKPKRTAWQIPPSHRNGQLTPNTARLVPVYNYAKLEELKIPSICRVDKITNRCNFYTNLLTWLERSNDHAG